VREHAAGLATDAYAASDTHLPPLAYGESALLVEFLEEDPGESDAENGRGTRTAVDLQCKLLQLLKSVPQSALLNKLACVRCFVPRTPIEFPTTSTHSLVAVPRRQPRSKAAADKSALADSEVKGTLGYVGHVEPAQTTAMTLREDDDLSHLRTPVTYRVAQRRITRNSARSVRRWHRLVQRLRFRHLSNALDASHIMRGPAPFNDGPAGEQHGRGRRERPAHDRLQRHPDTAEILGRRRQGQIDGGHGFANSTSGVGRDGAGGAEFMSGRPGEGGTAVLQMVVDERGRAHASRPELRHLISMPTGSAADGSEVFDGMYVWKKFESRKFGLPFWYNQETG